MVIQSIFKVIIFKKVVSLIKCIDWLPLRKNRPNTEFFLVHIFPHSNWIWRDTPYLSVFSPNARKYGPEKTSYLDTFLAVCFTNYLNVNELFTLLLVLFKRANYLLRSGHPEVFSVKGALKICSKFTGEHPCQSMISIKLLCNFFEITLRHGCSPINLVHIFRTPFSKKTFGWLLLLVSVITSDISFGRIKIVEWICRFIRKVKRSIFRIL